MIDCASVKFGHSVNEAIYRMELRAGPDARWLEDRQDFIDMVSRELTTGEMTDSPFLRQVLKDSQYDHCVFPDNVKSLRS